MKPLIVICFIALLLIVNMVWEDIKKQNTDHTKQMQRSHETLEASRQLLMQASETISVEARRADKAEAELARLRSTLAAPPTVQTPLPAQTPVPVPENVPQATPAPTMAPGRYVPKGTSLDKGPHSQRTGVTSTPKYLKVR